MEDVLTFDEIKDCIDSAMEDVQMETQGEDTIATQLNKAWNRGAKCAMNVAVLNICKLIQDRRVNK